MKRSENEETKKVTQVTSFFVCINISKYVNL